MKVPRELPWRAVALVTTTTTVVLALLLLPACCCLTRHPVAPSSVPVAAVPPIGTDPIPTPTEAAATAATQAEFRNVWFYLDEVLFLDIHELRGEMQSKQPGTPLNFDNKRSFVMRVGHGTIGLKSASLDRLLNAYVFGYAGAPLKQLHVTMAGKQLRQEGVIHKVVDLPFTMLADVSVSDGRIRLHPTRIDICGVNGLGLLKALGMTLQKMLPMPKDRGVEADGNDLLLDPAGALPPPAVELHLVEAHVEGDELVQRFDDGGHAAALVLPRPEETNTMYFRGGTLRIGKLLMVDADMQVVDADRSDPFEFFIDRYNDQLVEGFSRNRRNYGLTVFMRDYHDVGTPPRPGERLAGEKN